MNHSLLKIILSMIIQVSLLLLLLLLLFIDHGASAKRIQRCPPEFSKNHPYNKDKEEKIYKMIIERAQHDAVIEKLVGDRYTENVNTIGKQRLRQYEIEEKQNLTVIVPVIYHIIQKSPKHQPVPFEALMKNIEKLNQGFSGADGVGGHADSGIRFTLQGITTTVKPDWFSNCVYLESSMKKDTSINPDRFFNVWICDAGEYLGFTYLPEDIESNDKYMDGVVLHYQSFPKVDNYVPFEQFEEGDTLVHETGHYLGLLHTFDGGCFANGDKISDTAAESIPAYGTPCKKKKPRDTCKSSPGVDPVTNYMDYSDDICLDNFTRLQAAKMRTIMFQYRSNMTHNQPRECVSGGNIGNDGSWRLCTSECFNTDTPNNKSAPNRGWCYTTSSKTKWSDCCCLEDGCIPKNNIYDL